MNHGRTPRHVEVDNQSGELISYLVLSVRLSLVGLWVAVGDVDIE